MLGNVKVALKLTLNLTLETSEQQLHNITVCCVEIKQQPLDYLMGLSDWEITPARGDGRNEEEKIREEESMRQVWAVCVGAHWVTGAD